MSSQPFGGIPNPATHPTLGPAERTGLATEGTGFLETPPLPYGLQGPLRLPGFDLAGVFSAFWGGFAIRRYYTSVQWLPLITPETPGAVASATYDTRRATPTNYADGTFGVGWTAPDPLTGVGRSGYLSARALTVGINDAETTYQRTQSGVVTYTRPVVYWQPPAQLKKGDLLVLPDGRRCVVGDTVTPGQVFGTTIILFAELETRSSRDITYQVPL